MSLGTILIIILILVLIGGVGPWSPGGYGYGLGHGRRRKMKESGKTKAASVLVLGLLAGCGNLPSGNQVTLGQATAIVTSKVLPDSAIEKIVSICSKYGGVLKYASLPFLPSIVRESAIDAAAYCDQMVLPPGVVAEAVSGVPVSKEVAKAVVLPSTTDSNTANWMDKVLWGLKKAGEIARVALPGI